MRNHPRNSIQAVVSEAYRAAGGLENVHADLGLAISTLSEATEVPSASAKRRGGLGINYLDMLARMHAASAAVLAQHFAALAGGVFQPVNLSGNVVSLTEQSGVVAKEAGEAVAATLRAASAATANHRADAVREIDEAVAALLRAKAQINDAA